MSVKNSIHKRMNEFYNIGKNNPVPTWIPKHITNQLFYIYLFKKYGTCVPFKTDNDFLGLALTIDIREENAYVSNNSREIMNSLVNCINKKQFVVIPLHIQIKTAEESSGHANVLIYRKKENVIEHFEPHGQKLSFKTEKYSVDKLINNNLNFFVESINKETKNNTKITLIDSENTCPRPVGIQLIEEKAPAKEEKESKGYCQAWTFFFTELCLRYPNINSKEMLSTIYDIIDGEENKPTFLRNVIRGYVKNISDRLDKYYSRVYNTKITTVSLAEIGDMLDKSILNHFKKNMDTNEIAHKTIEITPTPKTPIPSPKTKPNYPFINNWIKKESKNRPGVFYWFNKDNKEETCWDVYDLKKSKTNDYCFYENGRIRLKMVSKKNPNEYYLVDPNDLSKYELIQESKKTDSKPKDSKSQESKSNTKRKRSKSQESNHSKTNKRRKTTHNQETN
jgi:hypothetical protein